MAHELTVVALFARREDAALAVRSLIHTGSTREHVGYLEPADAQELKNPFVGAAKGIAGGTVIAGLLAGAAVALVPGVGPALVAGALLPVAMETVTAAAAGGVIGALVGAAAGSEEAPYFMEEVQAGRLLVSVEVPDQAAEASAAGVLRDNGALEVDRMGTARLHAKLRHSSPAGSGSQAIQRSTL